MQNRYAMLTVDTEALPARAAVDHVRRLVWGEHVAGRAGIREMCAIGTEFSAPHVFFVDMCGDQLYPGEMAEVVRWLDGQGQDVQLHLHPEILPASFWEQHGLSQRPRYMNEYGDAARAGFVIQFFSERLRVLTGRPVQAYRAGSFRWNGDIIRALGRAGIPLSFNNSMRAHGLGRSPHAEPTNRPYAWSNGVIEVPVTERYYPADPQRGKSEKWVSLMFPQSSYFQYTAPQLPWWRRWLPGPTDLQVFLLHSWSLLHWDDNHHAIHLGEQRQEEYRQLVARIVKDYDVITTTDLLDLMKRRKIKVRQVVSLQQADPVGTVPVPMTGHSSSGF
ncbi:MAG TPA: polysaccharide deacetylase [Herbaspirillum sp.]|uniref:polysaccharide deacetylase n=1 Tax=Herbaspirillum sp. TaxID=1890675 RepID=UPI002D338C6B|nr:polysaccharide deacetylase [Herbaspirillum sp.]HZG22271.1 polysaccharide deacetylase [Herbaspirillum sp.]